MARKAAKNKTSGEKASYENTSSVKPRALHDGRIPEQISPLDSCFDIADNDLHVRDGRAGGVFDET